MNLFIKHSKVTILRTLVRLFTVLFFIPWFSYFSDMIFGSDFDLEVELVVLSTILIFGSFWCGWICPFGNASYFVEKVGKFLFPKFQVVINGKADKILRNLKYVFLAIFIAVFITQDINYLWDDHMQLYTSTTFTYYYVKTKMWLILFIPLFIPRFFCKYVCFQKGAYNIINKIFPITTIKRNEELCISCKRCEKICPMRIAISNKKYISGDDCIGCYRCLEKNVCPKDLNALELQVTRKKVNVFSFVVFALVLYYIVAIYFTL